MSLKIAEIEYNQTSTFANNVLQAGHLTSCSAKAWANFNQNGSAIDNAWENGSHNISSYTDLSTGVYYAFFADIMLNSDGWCHYSGNTDSSAARNYSFGGMLVGEHFVYLRIEDSDGSPLDGGPPSSFVAGASLA